MMKAYAWLTVSRALGGKDFLRPDGSLEDISFTLSKIVTMLGAYDIGFAKQIALNVCASINNCKLPFNKNSLNSNHIKSEDYSTYVPEILPIIKTVIRSDGYITHEMHDKFWRELNKIKDKEEIKKIISVLKANNLYAQELQKELWQSAKISFSKQYVFETDKLQQLKKIVPIKFKESLPYSKESAQFRFAMKSYNKKIEVSYKHMQQLLEACAMHKTSVNINSQIIEINESLIDYVLTNLNSSFQRLELLFNEDWKST